MSKFTHAQALNKSAKANLTPKEALNDLKKQKLVVPENFSTFLAMWDMSKNDKGFANFNKLGTLLEGYAVAIAEAVAVAGVVETEAVAVGQ